MLMSKKELEDKYLGKEVRIICMCDEPQYTDKIGTVTCVDDIKQLHGTWGGLALIPEEDEFELV